MRRANIFSISGNKVIISVPGEIGQRQKLYPYPKGVIPAKTDKLYLETIGDEEIIVLVQEGD